MLMWRVKLRMGLGLVWSQCCQLIAHLLRIGIIAFLLCEMSFVVRIQQPSWFQHSRTASALPYLCCRHCSNNFGASRGHDDDETMNSCQEYHDHRRRRLPDGEYGVGVRQDRYIAPKASSSQARHYWPLVPSLSLWIGSASVVWQLFFWTCF